MPRPHLIQIPALGCNARLYRKTEPSLSQHFNVTTHIPTADRYDTMVKELLAEAPKRFILMGTSMGARLALETTLAAPKRVAGLIMIGSAAGPVADQAAGLKR